jgi:hypothetical protein
MLSAIMLGVVEPLTMKTEGLITPRFDFIAHLKGIRLKVKSRFWLQKYKTFFKSTLKKLERLSLTSFLQPCEIDMRYALAYWS